MALNLARFGVEHALPQRIASIVHNDKTCLCERRGLGWRGGNDLALQIRFGLGAGEFDDVAGGVLAKQQRRFGGHFGVAVARADKKQAG